MFYSILFKMTDYLGQEPKNNVFVFLSYYEYQDGSVSIPEVSIRNKSNGNIYFYSVEFNTKRFDEGLPGSSYFCIECGSFVSRPVGNEPYLSTISKQSYQTVNLPSLEPDVNFSPHPSFTGKVNIDVTVNMIVPALEAFYANEKFSIPAKIWRTDFYFNK